MELEEWSETVSFVRDEIQNIIRAQRIHRRIRQQLAARDLAPLEEDFIDADLDNDSVGAPHYFDVEGVQIVTRKLHRRGLKSADVMGADLLYEIEGQKYAIIQIKKPDRNGRIALDTDQLDVLVENCPVPACDGRGHWPRCGSWYAVRDSGVSLYHQACEVRAIFGGAASRNMSGFESGLSKETFDELFALCLVGAPISPTAMGAVVTSSLNADRVLFAVLQRGRF